MHFPLGVWSTDIMGNRRIFLSKFSNFMFLHLTRTYGSILNRLSSGGRSVKTVFSHIFRVSLRTLLMTFFLMPNTDTVLSYALVSLFIIISMNIIKRKFLFLPKKPNYHSWVVQTYNLKKKKEEEETSCFLYVIPILQMVSKMIKCIQILLPWLISHFQISFLSLLIITWASSQELH